MRVDAGKEKFEEIEVLGKPALFTDARIDRQTIPRGLHYYEVRGDDDGGFDPVQIGEGILVNHYGSILTRKPIKLDKDGYLDINPEKDFAYISGSHMTAKEFKKKYPLKKREKER